MHFISVLPGTTERRWIVSWMNMEREREQQRSKSKRGGFSCFATHELKGHVGLKCVYFLSYVICYPDPYRRFAFCRSNWRRSPLLAASGSHFHSFNERENLCIEAKNTRISRNEQTHDVYVGTGPMSCELYSFCRFPVHFPRHSSENMENFREIWSKF